jgi:neutral ceramidase
MNRRDFLAHSAVLGGAARDTRGLLALQAGPALIPGIKAGFCERDITPDIGMEQPGDYVKAYHTKFHDACKVRAAVFDDGRSRVALVGVDALGVPRPMVLDCRKEIEQRCGLPPGNVLVGASHSHSSGPLEGPYPGQFDHASALVRELAYQKSPCIDSGYLGRVRKEIVNAVSQADSVRREVRCGFGNGVENNVAFNRRFRMKNGSTYTHPGQGNPDVVGYAGPTDSEVGVIGVWDSAARLVGCVVNYACHATTNPGGISANWIYYMENIIRGAFGQDVVVVFLQGACGDVTQVDNLSHDAFPSGERWAQLVGGRVGSEAVKVLLSVQPGNDISLDAHTSVLRIRRRPPSPEHVKRAYGLVRLDMKEIGRTQWAFAKETVILDAIIASEPDVDVEVQAIQVGPAIYISNPAELFCQYGLELKFKSPFPLTWPVELANGNVGYVPTEEAFGEHGGGYETRLTSYSNLEITAGSQIVAAGLKLAAQMRPGKMPERPKAQPFKEPWSYGNVPPDLS